MIDAPGAEHTPQQQTADDALALWAGVVQTHGAVARGLDADLRAAHGLTLSEFTILLWLSHEPCASMRMAALADMVQLSPSGVSRAIERLEARGLASRQQCSADRRGVDATLTDAGAELVLRAGETHAAGIRQRFLAHLTPEERLALGPACERVMAANAGGGWSGCAASRPCPETGGSADSE
jgi:DNA-binding MarR family transcriptional regulator